MSSDETTSSSFEDLEEYASSWSDKGYDYEAISNHFKGSISLSDIADVEAIIHRCETLRKRLVLAEVEDVYRDRLTNPFNTEDVEREFVEWSATNLPWESACFRYHALWISDHQKENQYWDLLEKFSSFDESSWPAIQLLTPFLAEPETYEEILHEVSKIEESEARQRLMLDEAVSTLLKQGFDIEKPKGNFIEQLSKVEHYQTISDRKEYILLEIKNSIQPFDPILSEKLEKRAHDLEIEDSESMEKIEKNIQTITHHLKERLAEMNGILANWNNLGFTYHSTTRIEPSELLEWEHMLPEIEQSFNIHSTAMERWEMISKSWELENNEIQNIAGKLEHTETFLEKIEELEQEWTNLELQTASIIEHWEQYGFDLDIWRYKATEEPRSALAELTLYTPHLEKASKLMDSLFNLDTSLGGEEDVEQRTILLQTADLGTEILSEMEDYIEKRTLRNTRHRRMLEREWRHSMREGKTTKEPDFSDLHSFEQAIASIERQGQSHQIEHSSSRIISNAQHELQSLESQGWNIGELAALADSDPRRFIQQFSSSRGVISNISKIQRRLSALDWRRDVTKGLEISEMIRNPISLKGIETQIPALIRHLSSRPIEDDDFTYPLWAPTQRPVLLPKKGNQIPIKKPIKIQPQTTLEDAQEAILEAMEEEAEPEILEPSVKEIESKKEVITQPSNPIVVEQPQEKPVQQRSIKQEQIVETTVNPRLLNAFQTILDRLSLSDGMAFNAQGALDTKHLRRTLAEHVGVEPRDVRVDRMFRLLLRLLPFEDDSNDQRAVLIDKIGQVLPKYQQWIRMRLEARHSGATGNFLEDSIQLGNALQRTPGPGVKVPLAADTLPLPSPSNLGDLTKSVQRLVDALDLNAAGGIN
jgi:hypothetical protein